MIIKPNLGWNRVHAPQDVRMEGDSKGGVSIQCTKLQNYYCDSNAIKKIGGTEAYNSTALDYPIDWVEREYFKLGDGDFVKRTICVSGSEIYYGDDAGGTLTKAEYTLSPDIVPTSFSIQIAGNSTLFILTGKDTPRKYDGNGSYKFEEANYQNTTDSDNYETGVVYLGRAWYTIRNSTNIEYSTTNNPEYIEDVIALGNARNSITRRIVVWGDDRLFIFKNDSIWEIYGRTPSTFQARLVTDKYGLAGKNAIYPVGSGFAFLNTFDKEIYFFGGTEQSTTPLTEDFIRFRDILNVTPQAIEKVCMTTHNNLFRVAFQHKESPIDSNNCELVYPINQPYAEKPRWSLIKGTNVNCYSVWNQQGDRNELVTGRSDTGKLMYHNRGNDFDGNAIETIARLGEVVLSEDSKARIKEVFIKAKPGSHNVTSELRYYLDGRYSVGASGQIDMSGETRTIGLIKLSQQALFNDRILLYTNYSKGNSVSFEIYDNNNGVSLEIYSLAFKATLRDKIRNKYV